MKSNIIKTVIILIAFAGIVSLVWLVVAGGKLKNSKMAQNKIQDQQNKTSPEKSDVPQVVETKESDLPPVLSKEVPHYSEVEKIESFSVQYPDSAKAQNIYRFYSSKSVNEVFDFYKDWMGKNGWMTSNTVKENNYQALLVNKSGNSMWVKISKEGEKTKVGLEMF